MIKYLSEKLAGYVIDDNDPEKYDVLVYGFDIWIQKIFIILIALIISIPLDIVLPAAVAYAAYNLLRKFAGGTHAKHRVACIVTSVMVLFAPSYIFSKLGFTMPLAGVLVLSVIDIILLLLYAPADTEIRPVNIKTEWAQMKSISLVIMLLFVYISLYLHENYPAYSSIIITNATVVCCLTHPLLYKIYGCKKSQ